jgi:hypothetical protein
LLIGFGLLYAVDVLIALRIQAPSREQIRDGRHDQSGQKASHVATKPRVRSQSRESREGEILDHRNAAGKHRTSTSVGPKDSRANLKYLEAKTLNLKLRVMNKVGSNELPERNGRTLPHVLEGAKMKPMNTEKQADAASAKSKLRESALRKCDVLLKRQHNGSQGVNSTIVAKPSNSMVSAT